jgi:hypothetical protein
MAIKIIIKKKSALKESVERIDEIFGFGGGGSEQAETTKSLARKGMPTAEKNRINTALAAALTGASGTHEPGSAEGKNGSKNPYNIPSGEGDIDPAKLLDMYSEIIAGGGRAGAGLRDRYTGILGNFADSAAKSDSDTEIYDFHNRIRLYLDDMYRRLLAAGTDVETGEVKECPKGQTRNAAGKCVDKGDGEDDERTDAPNVSCPDGYKWVARENGKSVAGGQKGDCVNDKGEITEPCPDGQTWDSEAGKCVDGADETPPPGGEDKAPVPIYKFPKEKGEDGKRLQPLSSKLAKAGLNKATINTILRSIAKQLKSNNVEITEGLLKEATDMVLERLRLTEKDTTGKYAGGADASEVEPMKTDTDTEGAGEDVEYEYKFNMPKFKSNKEYKNIRSRWNKTIEKAGEEATDRLFLKHTNEFAEFIGPFYPPKLFKEKQGARDEINKVTDVDRLRKNKKDIITAFKRLKKTSTGEHGAKIIILKAIGDNRKKISLRINAMLDSIDRSAAKGEEEKPEEKGPPKAWVTEGGTQEEWDALPNKEKFVFLKMESDKRRKFFKMSSEERLELYDEMKKGGATKASAGAEETADAQAAAGEKAAEKGFGDKAYKQGDGKIRISTLNQQLKTIDPQADQGERKKALNLVQKHLKPYLKINNLKLSESEIRNFTNQIVEVILKNSKS